MFLSLAVTPSVRNQEEIRYQISLLSLEGTVCLLHFKGSTKLYTCMHTICLNQELIVFKRCIVAFKFKLLHA